MATGLFSSASPQEMEQALLDQRAAASAALTPDQRLGALAYKAGAGATRGLGQAFGVDMQDPMIRRATMARKIAAKYPTDTAEGLMAFARDPELMASDPEMASKAMAQAKTMQTQDVTTQTAQQNLRKLKNTNDQEASLREALNALGPDAPEKDTLAAVTKFGTADNVLKVISTSSDKVAARAQALALAQQANDARVEAARLRGEDQRAIAQMQIDGRTQIAQLTAALKGEKPLTEFQGKALTFGTRAADASNIISSLEGKYNTLSSAYLPAFANSTEGQQVQQAQSNFVNAVLRQESGAAIATSEFDNAKKQYFPQYGDKPAVLAQKKANRERVIKGFSRQAGPGGKDVDEAFNTPTARIEAPAKNTTRVFASESAATAANLPRGTQITINGRKAVVE